jgi:hypothetical protein
MKNQARFILVVALAWCVFSPPGLAQAPKQIQRTPDGKPNFSGMWTGGAPQREGRKPGQPRPLRKVAAQALPLTPFGQKAVAYWTSADGNDPEDTSDPRSPGYHIACGSESSPSDLSGPVEITQSPRRVMMLHTPAFASKFWVRQLWIGEEHPKDVTELELKWMGHTVAKWDRDTLVADTVRVRVGTPWGGLLDRGIAAPHSEELRMIERFQLTDAETLRVERTLTDPKMYTKPLTDVKVYKLMTDWATYRADWEVIENQTVCVNGVYQDNVPWIEGTASDSPGERK